MKMPSLALPGLGLCVAGLVAIASAEEPAAAVVSPQARAVIARVHAAYSTVKGWNSTLVREAHTVRDGREEVAVMTETERFLPSSDGPAYFLFTGSLKDTPRLAIGQNREEQYMLARLPNGSFEASVSAPVEENRPKLWHELESSLVRFHYGNYLGREIVAGESCELVEFTSVTQRPGTPGQPKPLPLRYSVTYAVNPAGFIVQQRVAMNGALNMWSLARVTYDAGAALTPADFSREAFDREAARILRPGEPMPVLVPALFKPGQRLPEMSFVDWSDKQPFRLADFHGKIVVVETWASWCGVCKEAFPFYEKMRRQLEAQEVVFVAISFDHQVAAYEKWMKANASKYGFRFGLVDAPDAKAAMKQFKGALPSFYVLGRDGKILSSYGGFGYGAGNADPRLLTALREAGVNLDAAAAATKPVN